MSDPLLGIPVRTSNAVPPGVIIIVRDGEIDKVVKWFNDNARYREALAFAASVIKSGEPWTETCEEKIGRLLKEAP